MTWLLEIRDKFRSFYLKYDIAVRGIIKFLIAAGVFIAIIYQIGYRQTVVTPLLAAAMAIACIWLPAGAITFFMMVLISGSLAVVSAETAMVAVVLFLLMGLLYFIFKPKLSVLMAITMFACSFNFGGMIPIAVGLIFEPLALIPMCLGVISYYMIYVVRMNFSVLSAQNDKLTAIEKIVYYVQHIFQNEKMILIMAALIITVLIVYFIRKRPSAYAWIAAITAGLAVFVLVMLAGNLLFDIYIILPALLISCIIGVFLAAVVTLFRYVVDGTRTEHLEYEDDDYYYFVTAIPKVKVAAPMKKITRITEADDAKDSDEWGFDSEGKSGTEADKG